MIKRLFRFFVLVAGMLTITLSGAPAAHAAGSVSSTSILIKDPQDSYHQFWATSASWNAQLKSGFCTLTSVTLQMEDTATNTQQIMVWNEEVRNGQLLPTTLDLQFYQGTQLLKAYTLSNAWPFQILSSNSPVTSNAALMFSVVFTFEHVSGPSDIGCLHPDLAGERIRDDSGKIFLIDVDGYA